MQGSRSSSTHGWCSYSTLQLHRTPSSRKKTPLVALGEKDVPPKCEVGVCPLMHEAHNLSIAADGAKPNVIKKAPGGHGTAAPGRGADPAHTQRGVGWRFKRPGLPTTSICPESCLKTAQLGLPSSPRILSNMAPTQTHTSVELQPIEATFRSQHLDPKGGQAGPSTHDERTPSTSRPTSERRLGDGSPGETQNDTEPTGAHEFQSLPPADSGRQAWLFLAACFFVEALIWGECAWMFLDMLARP